MFWIDFFGTDSQPIYLRDNNRICRENGQNQELCVSKCLRRIEVRLSILSSRLWKNGFFFFSNILFGEDRQVVVIGVIGKSSDESCNKMAGLGMMRFLPGKDEQIADGQIKFYFDECNDQILYLHFETPFDARIMEKLLFERSAAERESAQTEDGTGKARKPNEVSFNSFVRTRFAQILLFAIHVCHVIVLVEPSGVFDSSYLNIFKALKVIRCVEAESIP